MLNLAQHATRDRQFAEIYHPQTGEIYGGMQERGNNGIVLWDATSRQTWAATAMLRMILFGLVGMRCDVQGARFEPCLPTGVQYVQLKNLQYQGVTLAIEITGTGTVIKECTINGQPTNSPSVDAKQTGSTQLVFRMQSAK